MSAEAHRPAWMGRRESQTYGVLIVLVGGLNLWIWISGRAPGWLAIVASVAQLALFVLMLARAIHFGRRNRLGR
jgi:hypothetical protein